MKLSNDRKYVESAWILLFVVLFLVSAPLGRAAESESPPAKAPKAPGIEKLIIAFKTHFDIGYTEMASNVVRRYRTTMIDEALRVCEQNRDLPPEQQFVWTIPGWPMAKILEDWPGQTPSRKQQILEAYQGGRFVTHALPFTTHTEWLDLEDLVRGLGFSSRLSRSSGLALPRDAKMTDVPCHSWVIPTLLKRAGVDFLHLGCNAASRSPEVPVLFWWQGPDGSKLLTMYTAESYGTGLIPPANWPHKTWLALIHTGDNHGPPRPDEVKKSLPGVQVQIGRLSDFADAILAEKPVLPIIRGDMPDTWIHGPMCDPQGANMARNTRPLIYAANALNSLLPGWGINTAESSAAVQKAYENSLLYGEHTWGGALYWVTSYSQDRRYNYDERWREDKASKRFAKLEASWDEHSSYIRQASLTITPVVNRQLAALARAVNIAGERIVVYNPLPWTRDGLVEIETSTKMTSVKALDDQQIPPAHSADGKISFLAKKLPPMGYRTYVPTIDDGPASLCPVDAQANTIENAFLKLTLDPQRGIIQSFIDKTSGEEMADASAPQGLGQYLYERFDASQVQKFVDAYVKIQTEWATNELGKPAMPPASQAPYRAISPGPFTVSYEQTPNGAVATLKAPAGGGLPHGVTTIVRVYPDQPYVDLEVQIENKPADPWPEAGWICLPFKIKQPEFRLGRLSSIIDPVKDIVPGANHHLFGIDTGVALFDRNGRGMGICPRDHWLVSLDTPGCWLYSRHFTPSKPVVYVNLFNNQWTTNFRLWNEGSWSSRVRLWAFRDFAPDTHLVRPSLEARYPLLAARAGGPAGKSPVHQAGPAVFQPGLQITALGANPDGSGLLLRLWELGGKNGNGRVLLPDYLKITSATPVDLRGRALDKAISVKDNLLTFPMQAFAPHSFLLNRE